jgi:excisionase family DNA binding protein
MIRLWAMNYTADRENTSALHHVGDRRSEAMPIYANGQSHTACIVPAPCQVETVVRQSNVKGVIGMKQTRPTPFRTATERGAMLARVPDLAVSQPSREASEPVLFTVATVARIMSLSRKAVYEYLWSGALGHVKIGRRIRIEQEQLHRFLRERTVDSVTGAARDNRKTLWR